MSDDLSPCLYLIPSALGEPDIRHLSPALVEAMDSLDYFIVERARSARRFIKACLPHKNIGSLEIVELDKHDAELGVKEFIINLVRQNRSAGLLSEAGAPAVADPGALIVAKAHASGVRVVPLVGPSAILLALMASGMNGQAFCFHGYLPVKKPELSKALRKLEERVARDGATQLFIEAPYRNQSLISTACEALRPDTRLCMAIDLTLPTEQIIRKDIRSWQVMQTAAFHKRPAIFLIGR